MIQKIKQNIWENEIEISGKWLIKIIKEKIINSIEKKIISMKWKNKKLKKNLR